MCLERVQAKAVPTQIHLSPEYGNYGSFLPSIPAYFRHEGLWIKIVTNKTFLNGILSIKLQNIIISTKKSHRVFKRLIFSYFDR